jgi:predicted nucleic acid-binding protein
MIPVFNTTLLRHMIAIEQEYLLGQLFEKVLVFTAVHEELTKSQERQRMRTIAS